MADVGKQVSGDRFQTFVGGIDGSTTSTHEMGEVPGHGRIMGLTVQRPVPRGQEGHILLTAQLDREAALAVAANILHFWGEERELEQLRAAQRETFEAWRAAEAKAEELRACLAAGARAERGR